MHDLKNPDNGISAPIPGGFRDAIHRDAIGYAEQGAAIVLLHESAKRPIEKGWTDQPRMSPAEVGRAIVRARMTHGDVNIGLRLGEPSRMKDDRYIHAVDVDIRNAQDSERCLKEAFAAVYAVMPELENAPRVLSGSGSGSHHIYFTSDKPLRKKNIARSKRIAGSKPEWEADLFGSGAQVVLPPSIHPDTGLAYKWDRGRRPFFDDEFQRGRRVFIPAENLAPLYERRKEPSARDAAAAKIFNGDIDLMRSALDAIANDDLHHDVWFSHLCAIHFESDDREEWRELAHDYSSKSNKYDPDTTDRKWDSIKDEHATLATGATIRFHAWREGWHGPEGYVYGDGRVEPSFDMQDEREFSPVEQKRGSPLQFHYAGDLHKIREATYLVKHWIFEGQLSVIYGPPGAGKTFLALDNALHIARGWPWFEREVKRGVVIYMALEGISGISKRAEAWCKHHGVELNSLPIVFAEGMLDIRNDKRALADIADEGERAAERFGLPVRMIVIDTLARAMGGGDENSASDMGALVNAADLLRMRTGAHLCLIHHEGKDKSRGMRGSSSLLGAVDTAIVVGQNAGGPARIEAKLTKQKEGECQRPLRYTLETVSLDRSDEDGDPITSAVVAPSSRIVFDDERVSPRETAALEVLQRLVDDAPYDFDEEDSRAVWISVRRWRSALEKAGWPDAESDQTPQNTREKSGQIHANMGKREVAQNSHKRASGQGADKATNEAGQGADNLRTIASFEREFRRLKKSLVNKGVIRIEGENVSIASE